VYGISGPAFAVVGILVLAADLGLKETFGKFLPEVGSPAPARYIFRRFVFVCLGLIGLFLLILDRMRPASRVRRLAVAIVRIGSIDLGRRVASTLMRPSRTVSVSGFSRKSLYASHRFRNRRHVARVRVVRIRIPPNRACSQRLPCAVMVPAGERAWNAPAHPVALAGEERRFSQPSASPDLTQAVL